AAAFRALPERRLIVAGDGPEAARVRAAGGANVEFVCDVSRERMRGLLGGARGFIFAAEEDFGIIPVEAQACGTPVIAYGRGGSPGACARRRVPAREGRVGGDGARRWRPGANGRALLGADDAGAEGRHRGIRSAVAGHHGGRLQT